MSNLIERVKSRIAELEDQRTAVDSELSAIAADPESRGFESEDAAFARISELRAEGEKITKEITEAEDRAAQLTADETRSAAAATVRPVNIGGGLVRSEAKTYTPENREVSFFADAYNAERGHNTQAQDRIQRHMREVEVERRDITSGTLNGLVPPLYLLDQAATLARAMRPFANALPGYQLPPLGMSVVVTKVTTGTATAAQTTQNTGATETDMVTTDVTIPVVTIMGQQDVSRQAIERGAITDSLIFSDLVADYATRLDSQLISGTGSNGQHKGIITAATGTDSYAGTTAVNVGTLLVNGQLGTGAVSVAPGASLGGSGVIGGAVTVDGLLSPGNSPGDLSVASLVLDPSSTVLMEIDGTTVGTQYDQVSILSAGSIAYDGTLQLNLSQTFGDNTTFNLFEGFGSSFSGNFATITSVGSAYTGLTFTRVSNLWTSTSAGSQSLEFNQATGQLVIVPEPAALALAGGGVAVAAWVSRIRAAGRRRATS